MQTGRPARPLHSANTGRGEAGLTFCAIAAAWCIVASASYYTQLWAVLAAGPSGWTLPDLGQDLRHTGLPHVREAAVRAAAGIWAATIVLLAMGGLGRALDRWVTPSGLTAFERWIVRIANGAGALGIVLLALACAGAYRPGVVRAVVGSAALLCVLWHLRDRARVSGEAPGTSKPPRAPTLTWMAISALAAALAFVTALAPETGYDALWYHLELPRRWLAAGRPVDDVHEYVSLYPLHWDLLFGATLAFDGTAAPRLLHWTTLVAGAGVAGSIARRALGAPHGWTAAAVYMTAPTVLWEASSAYVDLALAMHCGVAAGALWQSTRDADRRWTALAGVNVGIACATKHLGLAAAAIVVLVYLLWAVTRRLTRDALRRAAAVGLIAAVIPAPWYVRAWHASGNPVFPEMYRVFGASPPERWDALTEDGLRRFKARFGAAAPGTSRPLLPIDVVLHGARYGGTLGPVLLLVVPGVFVVLRRSAAARWLAAASALYLLLWASPLSSLQVRFLIPWWLPVSALAAAGIAETARAAATLGRHGTPLVHAAAAAVCWLNLPPFTPLHERDREGWTGWLTHVVRRVPVEVVLGGWSEDEWLRSEVRSYPAWHYLNQHAPSDARVLTFFGGDHFYSARDRLWSQAVAARPVTWGATDVDAGTLLSRLRARRITHIIAPRRPPHRTAEHDGLAILRPDVIARFRVVHEDYWVVVYRVDGSAETEAGVGATGAPRTDQRYGK